MNPYIKLAGLRAHFDETSKGQGGKTGATTNKPTRYFCPFQKRRYINRCIFHFLLNNTTLKKKSHSYVVEKALYLNLELKRFLIQQAKCVSNRVNDFETSLQTARAYGWESSSYHGIKPNERIVKRSWVNLT